MIRKKHMGYNDIVKEYKMDDKVTVVETTVAVKVSNFDKLAITILGAIPLMVVSNLVEKGYFTAKARYQIHKNPTTN